jgi:NAD(P)-dependent dehydrogenase (short-subunit alcohol dehydrogenase family)
VIVSGGTGSIGRAIGFLFARLAHVIIVRRNAEKAGRARG